MTAADAPASRNDAAAVEFGPFRFDPARSLLTREGAPVALGFRSLELLRVLVEHAPSVVDKSVLLQRVWPGVFVEETALRFHVSALRRALGDGEDGARYVSTASGKGYGFVGRLRRSLTAPASNGGAVAGAAAPPTNLPPPLSEIIGRDAELEELADWLGRSRLVSLVGPGGVGKTRLALEHGRRRLDHYPDGVWLVDLAAVSEPDGVAAALATALGVSVSKLEGAADAVVAALRKARLLLIFDNCEHLSDAVAAQARSLLERAAGLSILATSQKPLNLAAEQIFSLDPLPTPPPGAVALDGFAAVQLFVRRAQAADRMFTLDRANSAAVGEICRQLDGLPLALEMAARRLRVLGVEGLRRGLAERLRLLTDLPLGRSRHTTLFDMLEWSHGLLTPFDQRVFRRLAVFPAGFSLEAAIAVAREDETERWPVVDALGRLLDQSLIGLESREPARYRLLGTLRLYAASKLRQSGEETAVATRHARHFIEVFEAAEACWETTPESEWIAAYQPELDNLRSALDWTLDDPDRRPLTLALAAAGGCLFRGPVLPAAGRRYLDRAIDLLDPEVPVATAARLLNHTSILHHIHLDARALPMAERAARLLRDGGDQIGLANALLSIAQCKMRLGDTVEGTRLLLESRQLLSTARTGKSMLRWQVLSAFSAYYLPDFELAKRRLTLLLNTTTEMPIRLELIAYNNLSIVEYMLGNYGAAIDLSRTVLRLKRFSMDYVNLGRALRNLGAFLIADNRPEEARDYLQDLLSSRASLEEDFPSADAQIWAALGAVEGRLSVAARLIGYTDAKRRRDYTPLQPSERPLYDRTLARLAAGLPSGELDACRAEGESWSAAQVVAFLTEHLLPPPSDASAGRAMALRQP